PQPFELLATATPTTVNLSWTTPQDDYGVVGYILLVNGVAQDTLSATATSYSATGLNPDSTYSFTLVAFDQAGNTTEASYTIDLSEVVDPTDPLPSEPEVPLAAAPPLFTPNDDGQNDTWQITLPDGQVLSSLKVYDQRGRVVFATSQADQPWDGTFQGKLLPKGPYYYALNTLDTNNNQIRSTTGSVALLR
ncbi:MAG: gliding motility-associated C-terminal domain-containing protein, partial [Tunicatimonas sp.]